MAFLFCDSFDHYLVSQVGMKYTSGSAGSLVAGVHGSAIRNPNMIVGLGAIQDNRCIMGCYYRPMSLPSDVFGFGTILSGNFSAGVVHGNSDGSISYQVLDVSLTTYTSAAGIIFNGQWHYVEVDLTIDSASGSVKIYVDDPDHLAPVLDVSGVPTIYSVYDIGFGWSQVHLGGSGSQDIDDFYVLDGAATDIYGLASLDEPLGPIEIDVVRPDGAGLSAQWTPSPAVPNWQNVDDLTPDGDTTYNWTDIAGVGNVDLFEMENINTNNGIIGQQLLINARRTEEGVAQLASLLRDSGVTYNIDDQLLAVGYFYRNRVALARMPNGDAITDARFNAQQAGYRREL